MGWMNLSTTSPLSQTLLAQEDNLSRHMIRVYPGFCYLMSAIGCSDAKGFCPGASA